ncbi:MAG: hypothetical protein JW768_09510 [Chitinispirillaceae bacterium]|nr:hypothetical protein [Chitinispirillaceae bacterium]
MPVTNLTPAALERRLKRRLLKAPQAFYASTVPGLEPVLKKEIESLPEVMVEEQDAGGVLFSGPFQTVYHAHLRLRTANRVLLRIASFTARSYPELYNKAKRLHWELFCGVAPGMAVEAVSRSSRLHHTGAIAETVGAACRDHMAAFGLSVAADRDAAVRFHVRFADDVCTVSADASGELLYKRGYRLETGHAPLRETIAAALLEFAQWRTYRTIADPLCGSGTMLIEAAQMAAGIMPGASRDFAFATWPSFRRSLWQRLLRNAQSRGIRLQDNCRLLGSDLSGAAVASARRNAARANVGDMIDFVRQDCFAFNRNGEAGSGGLVIANLPYGKRAFASSSGGTSFFRKWGRHCKRYCSGWVFGFLLPQGRYAAELGLPIDSRLRFENGGLNVAFITGRIPKKS